MKRSFVRNKRATGEILPPLTIQVAKRATKSGNGVIQALVNVLVYLFVFLVFFRDNLQYMWMFIAFMAASMAAQFLIAFGRTFQRTKRFPFFRVARDATLYREYLDTIAGEADTYIERYSQSVREHFFPPEQLSHFVVKLLPPLFCRLPIHADFLTLNLGLTHQPYPISIDYPVLAYNETDAALIKFRARMEEKIANRSEQPETALPYGFSLKTQKTLALVNQNLPETTFAQVLNALLLDLAVLQSSEEFTLCLVFPETFPLSWTRFLPHVWAHNRRLVFCGTEPENEFVKLLQDTLEQKDKPIVAVVDVDFAQEFSFYSLFNQACPSESLSVLFFSQTGKIPTRAAHHMMCCWEKREAIGVLGDIRLHLGTCPAERCEATAKQLFNIRLVDNHAITTETIPEQLTFFQLFRVSSAAAIPAVSAKEQPNIQASFPVRVGVGKNGQAVFLDLTNNGDGNHCLVTGTNGSGKSEFMLTFVLAACLAYSPEYLAFVAIDFKGGAMSSKIRDLPHCVGEFTNSQGDVSQREVTRIAKLLESEITHRERILQEANCDLQKYHQLYAQGKVKEALPRLLIVVDEVAVFFAKDDKATDYITHIATVGRSMGMILLLATQSQTGVIPSQVRTNININVAFYSEDDLKKDKDRIKGRACLNSAIKKDWPCQMALSDVHSSIRKKVDFLTLSGKSRIVSRDEVYSQFEQACQAIQTRYPPEQYQKTEVLTLPLEDCLEYPFPLSELQELYYEDYGSAAPAFPIGVADNIYQRRRDALAFSPGAYNLLVYGRPQSGKTTLVKALLLSLFHKQYGLRPHQIAVYLVAKNPHEYRGFCFPHVADILSEKDLYYFLLFLYREIKQRGADHTTPVVPLVAVIDDCYPAIQNSAELMQMFAFVTSNAAQYRISVVMTVSTKPGLNAAVFNNFDATAALYMGDDFDYALLLHLDAIKKIPPIKGRCLVSLPRQNTLETQIAFPGDDNSVAAQAVRYNELWDGNSKPKGIPLMPTVVAFPVETEQPSIPIGLARDLSPCYWNWGEINTYLISYFFEPDAVAIVRYLIDAFAARGFSVILVDSQKRHFPPETLAQSVRYFSYQEQAALLAFLSSDELNPRPDKTILIMHDFVHTLFPFSQEQKELVRQIDALISERKISGVFTEMKDSINTARASYTHFLPKIEGANSGLLLGDSPQRHTFGLEQIPGSMQYSPINVGWGVHLSPAEGESKWVKLATEVET